MDITKYSRIKNRITAKFSDGTEVTGRYDSFIGQYMMEFRMVGEVKDLTGEFAKEFEGKVQNIGEIVKRISVRETAWLDSAEPEDILRAYTGGIQHKLIVKTYFLADEGHVDFVVTSPEVK